MTVDAIRRLRAGDRVMCQTGRGVAIGRVESADDREIAVRWPDGSASVMQVAHLIDGRDVRHTVYFAYVRSAGRGRVAA